MRYLFHIEIQMFFDVEARIGNIMVLFYYQYHQRGEMTISFI